MATDLRSSTTGWGTTVARVSCAVVIGIVLFVLVGIVTAICLFDTVNRGSPELAARWRAMLEPVGDLDAAKQEWPGIQSRRFKNGEWAYGFCHDSHFQFRFSDHGGTLVVKDSRGAVRAFFGHVCGPQFLDMLLSQAVSLDDFYEKLMLKWGFKEHTWP